MMRRNASNGASEARRVSGRGNSTLRRFDGFRTATMIPPLSELPPLDLSDVPEELDSIGRRLWTETGAFLVELGVLKTPHRHCLMSYCEVVSRLERFQDELAVEKDTETRRVLGELIEMFEGMVRNSAESLGLTPASLRDILRYSE